MQLYNITSFSKNGNKLKNIWLIKTKCLLDATYLVECLIKTV